jgi:tRNA nucleotidyltransferase (CCA-adding enzyme)
MSEAALIEKLLKIEALFAGAATEGERASAGLARQRILRRLSELIPEDPPVEYKFTFRDMWSHKVFLALLRRYGLKPYRYHAQRYTTVMVQVPKRFVDETLWPEFQKINSELKAYLQEVTDRVVKQVLHEDASDAVVVERPMEIEIYADRSSNTGKPETSDNRQSELSSTSANPKKSKKRKKKKKRRRQAAGFI